VKNIVKTVALMLAALMAMVLVTGCQSVQYVSSKPLPGGQSARIRVRNGGAAQGFASLKQVDGIKVKSRGGFVYVPRGEHTLLVSCTTELKLFALGEFLTGPTMTEGTTTVTHVFEAGKRYRIEAKSLTSDYHWIASVYEDDR